jgi:hypothetical protein
MRSDGAGPSSGVSVGPIRTPCSMQLSFCWNWWGGERPRSARTTPLSQHCVRGLLAENQKAVVAPGRGGGSVTTG